MATNGTCDGFDRPGDASPGRPCRNGHPCQTGHGWAALTPTEVKVAYLVGEGLSNPDIGKRLFLSRYTVQVHVSKILAKLQVRSRVEVVGEVARHPAESQPPATLSTA